MQCPTGEHLILMKKGLPYLQRRTRAALVGLTLLLLAGTSVAARCEPGYVNVGGYRLWVQVEGSGKPTVVFESGGGDDSSVWAAIEPAVRKLGVRTIVYDRAGLGHSDPRLGPYHIDDEASALERALDVCGVRRPIVLVAHSYGGFVSTLMAAHDPRVAGVVFVDANLVDYFGDAQVAAILAEYTPQFDALEQARPKLAAVMIPLMKAYPETVSRLRSVAVPVDLPVIDIVAEHSWAKTPEDADAMRRVHSAFVQASRAREAVFAGGSSHYVMRDRPDLVIDAIKRMVERIRSTSVGDSTKSNGSHL
jgi:pimeloyl-ACP methyl ester carboxylesterase